MYGENEKRKTNKPSERRMRDRSCREIFNAKSIGTLIIPLF